MTKDGSNARKKAARELAAAEQTTYTEALRRIDQRSARTSPSGEQSSAAAGASRLTTRVGPPGMPPASLAAKPPMRSAWYIHV